VVGSSIEFLLYDHSQFKSTGKCLITLGSGINHEIRWRDVLLLSSHSYAVISRSFPPVPMIKFLTRTPDVHESPEDRILTILDSWVHPDKEKGNTSRMPT